jgi:hypothetical protein
LLARFVVACRKHQEVLIDSIGAFSAFVSSHREVGLSCESCDESLI